MTGYLFDIDGVLTDPREKKVVEHELFDELLRRLRRGDPVAINTGRSLTWLMDRVVEPLLIRSDDKQIFTHLFIVGEKGGTWAICDEKGKLQEFREERFLLPESLETKVETAAKKYAESMFFDTTKSTMISVEMLDNFDITVFHEQQRQFVQELQQILKEEHSDDIYTIDPTTISTDIERREAGKALGADRFISFLKEKQLTPDHFFAFGDTVSDLAMADELAEQSYKVTFIYTGDREKFRDVQRSYPIVFETGYTQGTLAYLQRVA